MANLTKKKYLDLSVVDHIKYKNSRNGLSAASRSALLTVGKRYNSYLKATGQKVDTVSISGFLEQQKYTLSSSSWNVIRLRLKKVLKAQSEICDNYNKRVLVDEIFTDIKPVRQEKSVVDYLSYQQILRLILGSSPRIALMIEFLFKTGCRISEMTAIRLMDIKHEKQVQIRLIGKGSKQRSVYIDSSLYHRIRGEFRGLYYLFENSRHHQYDRSNLFKKIRAAGKRVLYRQIYPHLLRHSTANYLLKECGKSPKYVSVFLGHSNSAICQEMYIHEQIGEEVVDLFKTGRQRREAIR